jgi:hypothetical protein
MPTGVDGETPLGFQFPIKKLVERIINLHDMKGVA